MQDDAYGKYIISRGGAVVARRAHNPKVAGSSPAPATLKRVFEDSLKTTTLSFLCYASGQDLHTV